MCTRPGRFDRRRLARVRLPRVDPRQTGRRAQCVALATLSPGEIDEAVRRDAARDGHSLYAVDEAAVARARAGLDPHAGSLSGLRAVGQRDHALRRVARAAARGVSTSRRARSPMSTTTSSRSATQPVDARRPTRSSRRIAPLERRRDRLRAERADRPTVFFAEWVDPIYCAGHWVPEMIELAGGIPLLARPRRRLGAGDARRRDRGAAGGRHRRTVRLLDADAVAKQAIDRSTCRAKRVYAVDANAYFARPGPRLIDGVELLAQLLHPELVRSCRAAAHPRGASIQPADNNARVFPMQRGRIATFTRTAMCSGLEA